MLRSAAVEKLVGDELHRRDEVLVKTLADGKAEGGGRRQGRGDRRLPIGLGGTLSLSEARREAAKRLKKLGVTLQEDKHADARPFPTRDPVFDGPTAAEVVAADEARPAGRAGRAL